ncbi:DUF3159 domain-containing protein [Kribbella qitaiheensis]|uniref:DUF3159 domain-containing protein n=1 Tax=Kribbella qitaiheensis TaxID=1544730 RepID=A0A7G6X870_9ACTN|nr:DUF3159 domain-containing protein [Kribbella qitaiheensis]QNE22435.1 DUF3159 domain-containing protein [Kribbella qitaiheensis]
MAEPAKPELDEALPVDALPADPPAEAPPRVEKTMMQQLGGWAGMLMDIGLPWIAFTIVYAFSDHDLKLALIVAISAAAVVGVFRLIRRQQIGNVIGGFVGVLISAWTAHRTGQAQDVYLPGILLNSGFGLVYLITILTKYPLFGLAYGAITQTGLAWRKDEMLFKALNRVTMVFTAQVGIRLLIMLPLYLAHNVNALGIAKVALGLPFYAVTLWVSYSVLRGSMTPEKWDETKDSITHMLRGTKV